MKTVHPASGSLVWLAFIGVLLLAPIASSSAAAVGAEREAWECIARSVAPGSRSVSLGDMEVPIETFQAWLQQALGGPSPQSAFDGSIAL